MALKVNYELDDIVYENAYLRIHKIRTVRAEYERLTPIDDPHRPNISEEIQWEIRLESSATAYVWIDEFSRQNRAQPLKWFTFDFEYDLNSPNMLG